MAASGQRASKKKKDSEIKVLLAEYDKKRRYALSSVLMRNGYNCVLAGSGTHCLNQVEHNAFDILIICNNFEDMPGIEVASMAKTARPNTKIVVVNEYPDPEEEEMAISLGADYYIPDYANKNFLLNILKDISAEL